MLYGVSGYNKSMGPTAPSGGSGSGTRIVRPNTELIESLSTKPLHQSRPREIMRITLIDDYKINIDAVASIFEANLNEFGINVKIIDIDNIASPQLIEDKFIILTASSSKGIRRMPELIYRHNVGLTITDYNMHDLTGAQIIKTARAMGSTGIMVGWTGMVGQIGEKNLENFYKAGADLAITKPFRRLGELII